MKFQEFFGILAFFWELGEEKKHVLKKGSGTIFARILFGIFLLAVVFFGRGEGSKWA